LEDWRHGGLEASSLEGWRPTRLSQPSEPMRAAMGSTIKDLQARRPAAGGTGGLEVWRQATWRAGGLEASKVKNRSEL